MIYFLILNISTEKYQVKYAQGIGLTITDKKQGETKSVNYNGWKVNTLVSMNEKTFNQVCREAFYLGKLE